MFKCSQYISRDGKSLVFMVYTISILVPALWQCHWRWHMHTYWPRIWKCNVIQDWWGHVWTGSRLHSPPCYTGKQAPFNIQCWLLLTPLHYNIHTAPFLIWTSRSPWSQRHQQNSTFHVQSFGRSHKQSSFYTQTQYVKGLFLVQRRSGENFR